MSRFLSKRFAGMQPYVPGEQPQGRAYVKLNTNESPFPPAPAVVAAVSNPAEAERLNLYPDPDTRAAADAIARYCGVRRENILLGNGSDEILAFCFQAFCDQDTPAIYNDITYGFYKVYARIYGVPSIILPLAEDLSISTKDFIDNIGTKFIANPNAPTGKALPRSAIEAVLEASAGNVVVVDEAYVNFGAESALPLVDRYENLVVVQTMSKARNLAGARIGYGIAHPDLIADLNSMKFSLNPYNVNRLSLLAAEASIGEEAYFQACTGEIQKTRAFTTDALRARGFTVLDSCANFVFAKPGHMSGERYYQALKERGVLVRHFKQERIADYVRITIGTMAQMERLLEETDKIGETGTPV